MRKSVFTSIVFLFFGCFAYGQISTSEEPISFRTDVPTLRASEKTQIILPSLDMEKIQQEDKEDEANGMPPRFGYIHDVSLNLENSGEWTVLSDGSRIWRLTLHCPNALSVNLLYNKFWLPDDTKFFIYSNDRRHSIGAFTSLNNKGSRNDIQGFATGLVYGDQVTLEYYLPESCTEKATISISGIVHGYRYLLPNKYGYGNVPVDPRPDYGFNQSGNCQININCQEGNNWQNEKRAIALIIVNGNRNCTGSLINNTNNDYYRYFLTANHCLGGYDAINNPNLKYWTFYWNYELPPNPNDCNYNNSNPSEPMAFSTSGAKILANDFANSSDFALLELTEDPMYFSNQTPSYYPYYLGWDCSGNAGTGGVGIHHPKGDIKKISSYIITPQSTNYLSDAVGVNGNHWRVTWSLARKWIQKG